MENKFDLYDVPAGHEARFLEKVEASERKRRRAVWAAVPVAAAVALGIWFWRPFAPDYFHGVEDSPEAVYLSYLEQVEASYREIAALPESEQADWEGAMRSVTEETIPMIDQLPEEMPAPEKTAVLKAYYGDLLAGVERIKESVENL